MKDAEINCVVLTDKAVEILHQLQNKTGIKELYLNVIPQLTRFLILGIGQDYVPDDINFGRIKALTMLRCDIESMSKARDDETTKTINIVFTGIRLLIYTVKINILNKFINFVKNIHNLLTKGLE